jgi:peroxiredoxin
VPHAKGQPDSSCKGVLTVEQALLTTVVILLSLILVSLWLVLYQLVKQQGRILLRLEAVEGRAPADGHVAARGVRIGPSGLGVGKEFEPFSLHDLEGQTISLADFRGKRVLVVNWSPQCGFCDLIAPELAKLQADLSGRGVQLLMVSSGDADSNRKPAEEHGLSCPILLLNGSGPPRPFEGMGTPVAYLLDKRGRVARPVAIGSNEVPALAREAAAGEAESKKRLLGERPLSESRIEREGLKAGTPAPSFILPDTRGGTTKLEDFRGRRVLLVFTDPHCGPCDALAPSLVRLHKEHRDNGLAVVMVGRGEPEENRRKAEQHGIEFPFVIQDGWKLSRAYGIFATPVAFLIDERGVIAGDVGVGAEKILALADEALTGARRLENGGTVR